MDRDEKGHFLPGHKNVGAGRKPKSHEEKLLKAVSDSITPEDIRDILNALKNKARHGSIEAARVILAYAIGMPVQRSEITGAGGDVLRVIVEHADDHGNAS